MERKLFESMELNTTSEQLMSTFVVRRDLYARQLADGRYVCVRKPVTENLISAHLRGEITLGTYVLDTLSRAHFIVFDADTEQSLTGIIEAGKQLLTEGVPSYLELSRRGGHLWFFFDEPLEGEKAQIFGKGIQKTFELSALELFPKQGELLEGPGSCIRLPFGIHQASGRRYPFIDLDGTIMAPTIREQITVLANPETVPDEALVKYCQLAPVAPETAKRKSQQGDAIWDEIKERAPAISFIGAFVPLKKTASGGVGKCPFHDDQHESFGVNTKGNYWHCFAGCGGGSVIDFWVKWRKVEFPVAVRELAELLGVKRNGFG